MPSAMGLAPRAAAIARFAGEDSNLYGRTVEHHALGVDVPALLQRAAASYRSSSA